MAFADFASAKASTPSATEANLERSRLFAIKGDILSSVVDMDEGNASRTPAFILKSARSKAILS